MYCDRCKGSIEPEHYHCVQCPNYDICKECGTKGIYCINDSHDWVIRRWYAGTAIALTQAISPTMVRTNLQPSQSYPSVFQPPDSADTPSSLFENEHRFISKNSSREILIYTDGNSPPSKMFRSPRAGWAFTYRPSAYSSTGQLTYAGTVFTRLENEGPDGRVHHLGTGRAELRAVVGALQFRDWATDCNSAWRSIVIATDSKYVYVGATEYFAQWEARNWEDVKDGDLRKLLLDEIRKLHRNGVHISFWQIYRDSNLSSHFSLEGAKRDEKQNFKTVVPAGTTSHRYI